jgi:hypothetical protein
MSRPSLLLVLFLIVTVPATAASQGCLANRTGKFKGSTHHSMRSDDDDQRLTVRWQRGECEIRVDARGDFAVRGDLSGFLRVANGGYVQIEERDGDLERKVRVTSGAGGLEYRWTVDGENRFDVNRERWLADILIAVERRTAMFAKTRVPELVRQGGPNAVLEETARMDSDYARRTYFTILLASSSRLDEGVLERMLRQAADFTSDYERAETLREKRRSLSAGLESVSTLEARNALFNAASTMSSSYELAELLIAAQQRNLVDSLTRAAYFRAVQRLTSDYEHRRTLSSLLKLNPGSPAVLADVLRSSQDIDSDHELANLLVEFTRVVAVRGDLRELYLRAARSIESDHEYRRALQALLQQDRRT